MSEPLVAYRIVKDSLSSDRLKIFGSNVRTFEILAEKWCKRKDERFEKIFGMVFASKRRLFAKLLMGAGRTSEAQQQIGLSLKNTSNIISMIKSFALLLLTFLPAILQPTWPQRYRLWKEE